MALRAKRPPLSVLLALGLAASLVPVAAPPATAVSPDVVISQVYGGGGNSGATLRSDFIELFNRGSSAVDLSGWSLQYGSAGGTTWLNATPLSGTIEPGQHLLVQQATGAGGTQDLPTPDVVGSIPMSATGGKVALVTTTTPLQGACPTSPTIRDVVGYGPANCAEGDPAPLLSNTTAALRVEGGCRDSDDNSVDLTTAAPMPRNSQAPATPCQGDPGNAPVQVACGAAVTAREGASATATVTASDADGVVTDVAVSQISPSDPGTITRTAFTPASQPGGTATATLTVAATTPSGAYTVTATAANADTPPQTATCTLSVTVQEVLPIGAVQGSVADSDDGDTHTSPLVGQRVQVQGVITQRTLSRTSAGVTNYGFFLQDTAATADGDPTSSDGIFVFQNRFPDLIGGYVPQVGDEVVISGAVSEFFDLTQLSSASLVELVRSGVDLDAEVPAFDVDPPDDLDDAHRYWERREGMRGRLPAGARVVAGRDVFASTADGEVWVIRGDHPVAQRLDPYAARVFRDPHPLDDSGPAGTPGAPPQASWFDNGNGARILLGSYGVKWTAQDSSELIAPARTFDTVTDALVGGVYYSFGKYGLQPEQQPQLVRGADPAANAPFTAFDRGTAFSAAVYNVENLYDHRDDPHDGCDFPGNSGCPGVSPPFDYVPASEADYAAHLDGIAAQIVDDLHAPDILLVQEAEDQDICAVAGDELVCGTADDADGEPDTLQELALVIRSAHGVAYDAAYDRDGADDRGIVSGFLYRSDRVELLPADPGDPVLGDDPQIDHRAAGLPSNDDVSNPKTLNAVLPDDVDTSTGTDGSNVFTRAPQVARFRVWRAGVGTSTWTDLYAISNHFSSGPDGRVGQRTEQAAYNAAIVAALQDADPDVDVVVGGDFNVFPRPDDPFAPGDPLFASDQLAPLYAQGLTNVWDRMVAEVPEAAYSYLFEGQAQTLDAMFLSPGLWQELEQARASHVNADWPAAFDGDGARGVSDHDPVAAQVDVTPAVDDVAALVERLVADGRLHAGRGRALLVRLERYADALAAGRDQLAAVHLAALASTVEASPPPLADPAAADGLLAELALLGPG